MEVLDHEFEDFDLTPNLFILHHGNVQPHIKECEEGSEIFLHYLRSYTVYPRRASLRLLSLNDSPQGKTSLQTMP